MRETLQKRQGVVSALAIVAIVLGSYVAIKTVFGPPKPTRATSAFYSTDDGHTWFVDDIKKVPPYKTAEGKDAVTAIVATCGKEPFVMYLWRYTEAGKEDVEKARTGPDTDYKREVKKPGASTWTKTSDIMRSSAIQAIECPPGQEDFKLLDP